MPAGKSDRGQSKTELRKDPGEEKTRRSILTNRREGVKIEDDELFLFLFSFRTQGTCFGSDWIQRWERILFLFGFLRRFHCADTARQAAEHREGPAALLLLCRRCLPLLPAERERVHAAVFSTLYDIPGEGDKLG